jgi:hypothetical protein
MRSKRCELILKNFKFLKRVGFKCVVAIPAGFDTVRYDYKDLYMDIGTDYREKTEYFHVSMPTGKTVIGNPYSKGAKWTLPEIKRVYAFDIGTPKERQ